MFIGSSRRSCEMMPYGETRAPEIVRKMRAATVIGFLATIAVVGFAIHIGGNDVELSLAVPAIVILFLLGQVTLGTLLEHQCKEIEGLMVMGEGANDPNKMLLNAASLYWVFDSMPWKFRSLSLEASMASQALGWLLTLGFSSKKNKTEDDPLHTDHLRAQAEAAFGVGCQIRDLRQRGGNETAILNAEKRFDQLISAVKQRMPEYKTRCTKLQTIVMNGPLVFGTVYVAWFCLVQFMNS